MYDRFFAFGCSYTKYKWPTWADIIAKDLEIPYYNYALPGLGNVAIMHEIIAADLEHTFTDNDLIIIVWTHWSREDRFNDSGWKNGGSVFNNEFYDKTFVKKHWSYANDIVKNSTAIISINKLYKDKVAYQAHIMQPSSHEGSNNTSTLSSKEKDLMDFYKPHLPFAHVLDEHPSYFFDNHPSVGGHLKFVDEYIYPSLGLLLKESTVAIYEKIETQMQKVKSSNRIPEFKV